MGGLITLVVVLVVIGLVLWLIEARLPIDPTIKRVIEVVVILAVCLYLLRFFGVA